MPGIEIKRFLFDDENEGKFAAHGISLYQVYQALQNKYVVVQNRKERRASHLFVGEDDGGMCIAMPIAPSGEPGVWRPVTAWPCKGQEKALLK